MSITTQLDGMTIIRAAQLMGGWVLAVLISFSMLAAASVEPWHIVLLWILAAGALLIVFLKFEWGVYALVFLVPVSSIALCFRIDPVHGSMIDFIGKHLGIFVYTPVVFASFFGFLLAKWSGVKKIEAENPLKAPTIVFLFYACIAMSFGVPLSISGVHLLYLILSIMIYTMFIHTATDESSHRKLMWLLFFAGVFHASAEIMSYFVGGKHAEYKLQYYIVDSLSFVLRLETGYQYSEAVLPRRAGFLFPPSEIAAFMNIVITIAVALFLTEKEKARKIAILSTIPLFISVNLLAMSMGATVTLVLTVLFLTLGMKVLRKHFVMIMMVLVVMVAFIMQFQSRTLNGLINKQSSIRIVSQGKLEKGDTGWKTRQKMWEGSFLKMGSKPTRLLGLGMGSVPYYIRMPHAHSIYMSAVIDFGLAGLGVLLWVIVILIKRFKVMPPVQDSYVMVMRTAHIVMIVAFSAHGVMDFDYSKPLLWLVLAMAIAVTNLAGRELPQTI